ncbi:unknown [Ruminococcus sp. CAG:624]|nr:unknown [Ruminococcus sp. CAG:624]
MGDYMGLFSGFFKQKIINPKIGDESKKTIELLRSWHNSNFTGNGYCYNKVAHYQNYLTDGGEKIPLSQIRIPMLQQKMPKTVFGKIKAIAKYLDEPYLPYYISDYHDKIHKEICRFQDNLKKFENLSAKIKEDSLFEEIDHIFNSKLKILYNELVFCKYDKLGNAEYFNKMNKRLTLVYQDIQSLNTDFADYMYALTNTEYENTKQDLELIRIRVDAMSEVSEQYADECI